MSRMTTEHNNADQEIDRDTKMTEEYFKDSYFCDDHKDESAGDVY